MCMINNVTKSWLKLEASALEKYKHANEGSGRTAGSYILTSTKSLIKLADEDPEMFKVKSLMTVGPVIAAAAIGSAGTAIYFKLKERKNDKENTNNSEKEND